MVRPTSKAFTVPTRQYARLILDGTMPVAHNVDLIRAEIERRRLRF
jgi:hypothetical protein